MPRIKLTDWQPDWMTTDDGRELVPINEPSQRSFYTTLHSLAEVGIGPGSHANADTSGTADTRTEAEASERTPVWRPLSSLVVIHRHSATQVEARSNGSAEETAQAGVDAHPRTTVAGVALPSTKVQKEPTMNPAYIHASKAEELLALNFENEAGCTEFIKFLIKKYPVIDYEIPDLDAIIIRRDNYKEMKYEIERLGLVFSEARILTYGELSEEDRQRFNKDRWERRRAGLSPEKREELLKRARSMKR